MTKEEHLEILTKIKEISNKENEDCYVIHNMLFPMMDEGFEPDNEILSNILKEQPDLVDEIQIFKHVVKEVRQAFRNIERAMTPY